MDERLRELERGEQTYADEQRLLHERVRAGDTTGLENLALRELARHHELGHDALVLIGKALRIKANPSVKHFNNTRSYCGAENMFDYEITVQSSCDAEGIASILSLADLPPARPRELARWTEQGYVALHYDAATAEEDCDCSPRLMILRFKKEGYREH